MATSTINIPDHIKKSAETHAVLSGFAGADEYVLSLILADAGGPIGAELEIHLLRAIEQPSGEMTPADWDAKRQHLLEKHPPRKFLIAADFMKIRPSGLAFT